MMRPLPILLVMASALAAGACTPYAEDPEGPAESATLGPTGGDVQLGELATLRVPEGALPEDVEVRVAAVDPTSFAVRLPMEAASSSIIEITPHGQLFDKPVEVSLRYDPSLRADQLRVMRLDDAADPDWEPIAGVEFEDGVARFEAMTFSYYTVAIPEPTCYAAPAPQACDCGADAYCDDDGECRPIAKSDLCSNAKIHALHNGFAADDPTVDRMASAFAQACGKSVTDVDVTDPAVIDPCSSEPLLGAGDTLLIAGGPLSQSALLHYDRRISPVFVDVDEATGQNVFSTRGGRRLVSYDPATIDSGHDYVVIQAFPDTSRGALVISAFGYGADGYGTIAAGWYFSNVLLPNFAARTWNKFVVLEWTDDGDGQPEAAEFVERASDPQPPPPPATETPWQSNVNGAPKTPSQGKYAMGYKFTPQAPGKITALGGFFSGTKVVKLFRGTTELAKVTVTGAGNWAYEPIEPGPVSVAAGTQYTVAVYLDGSGGSNRVSTQSLPRTYGSIRIDRSTQVSTLRDANAIPTANFSSQSTMLGMADIKFVKN